MLASNPPLKKPVPKIDFSLHRCRTASEHLGSGRLGWVFSPGPPFPKLKCLYVKTMEILIPFCFAVFSEDLPSLSRHSDKGHLVRSCNTGPAEGNHFSTFFQRGLHQKENVAGAWDLWCPTQWYPSGSWKGAVPSFPVGCSGNHGVSVTLVTEHSLCAGLDSMFVSECRVLTQRLTPNSFLWPPQRCLASKPGALFSIHWPKKATHKLIVRARLSWCQSHWTPTAGTDIIWGPSCSGVRVKPPWGSRVCAELVFSTICCTSFLK